MAGTVGVTAAGAVADGVALGSSGAGTDAELELAGVPAAAAGVVSPAGGVAPPDVELSGAEVVALSSVDVASGAAVPEEASSDFVCVSARCHRDHAPLFAG